MMTPNELETITNRAVLERLGVPRGHKVVRADISWAEWLAMPAKYDPSEVTEEDARTDNMVRVLSGSEVLAAMDAVEDQSNDR